MIDASDAYRRAEHEMDIPPVAERGRRNLNPAGIGFWALVAEDFRTHERKPFEQGFWAIFVHRFGNWRMGQPKLVRAPATLLYRVLFKLVEWLCGISLWYTVKLGRRVRIWHHSGMSLGARAIGDDVQIRQNTTLGVAQTGVNDALPIIADGADIGAGAVIAGAVYVGRGARIGANALVLTDVPDGATAMGNPAMILARTAATVAEAPLPAPAPEPVPQPEPVPVEETTRGTPLDMGRVAILGSANLDLLADHLADMAARHGMTVATHVPPFGQARMDLLRDAADSPLQQAMARAARDGGRTATLIVERADDILGEVLRAPLSLPQAESEAWLEDALAPMLMLMREARARLPGPILVTRLAAFSRSSLGLADGGRPDGLAALLVRANAILAREAAALSDTHLLDTGAMLAELGQRAADPGGFWHLGRMPFSSAFGAHLAKRTLGALLSLRGQTARILVLDLDNTLWGGVLGEDGIEGVEIGGSYPGSAYRAFQDALLALSQRGIALAVASKNDPDLALRMMAEHPEMAIRPGNLVAHRIGWSEKALGLREILDEIGLGEASCLFIDDNPVERQKIRRNLPEAIVPPFPAAPEDLAGWILDSPWLECLELTASDLKRTAHYQSRARITAARQDFRDIADFYRDLDMSLVFEPYGPTNQKRVLQLFAKTNQFNATLRRHDAASLGRLTEAGAEIRAIGLSDRHSPYELMGVIVLAPDAAMKAAFPGDAAVQAVDAPGALWVESLLLSCRILGRTVEDAVVAWATGRAARQGAALIGQIIETPRNTPVRGIFAKAGFVPLDTGLDLGAGGIWRHDSGTGGALPVPDHFTLSEAPPAAPAAAAPDRTRSLPAMPDRPRPPAPPPAAATLPPGAAAATLPPAAAAALPASLEADLASTFRRVFRLTADTDLGTASTDSVAGWDSLGHLRLAMEIEQSLGRRIPGDRLGRIRSYQDLRMALAGA